MNAVDLLPIDLIPGVNSCNGFRNTLEIHRTADVNIPMSMALGVFILLLTLYVEK